MSDVNGGWLLLLQLQLQLQLAIITAAVAASLTQISCDSGFKKLNTPGFCLIGFLIIIEIPSDINGLLKSITRSRSLVMVIGAIAMSASYGFYFFLFSK